MGPAILGVTGYDDYFTTAHNLCRTLVERGARGKLASQIKTFIASIVLVIDDDGLMLLGGTEASAVFFQVVSCRDEDGHPTVALVTRNQHSPLEGHDHPR